MIVFAAVKWRFNYPMGVFEERTSKTLSLVADTGKRLHTLPSVPSRQHTDKCTHPHKHSTLSTKISRWRLTLFLRGVHLSQGPLAVSDTYTSSQLLNSISFSVKICMSALEPACLGSGP